MMKFMTTIGASAILALGFMSSAQADPIGGSQNKADNSCFIVWWFFVDADCSYDASRVLFTPNWVGPIKLYGNHLPGGFAAGDDEKRLRYDGDMTVTGNSGAGDIIDATLTVAAGERVGSCGQGGDCLVSWDSVTHTISAAADRASANAAGGFTYEVAANTFPLRLQPCVPSFFFPQACNSFGNGFPREGSNFAVEPYPTTTAPPIPPICVAPNPFPPPECFAPLLLNTAWTDPAPVGQGVASFEGGRGNRNTGTTSSAVVTGYNCTELAAGSDCTTSSTLGSGNPLGGSFDFENVLLKVDTNAAGGVISATMSYTQEYVLVVPFLGDSWDGNIVEMSGFVAVAKPGASPDIQIDKRNPLSVVIYGTAALDVSSIDISSLSLAGGNTTAGNEIHGQAHIGDKDGDQIDDLTAHFASNASDLRCGMNEATLSGVSDGVPFTTTVTYNGIGKACST
jgi:hypothetical protein